MTKKDGEIFDQKFLTCAWLEMQIKEENDPESLSLLQESLVDTYMSFSEEEMAYYNEHQAEIHQAMLEQPTVIDEIQPDERDSFVEDDDLTDSHEETNPFAITNPFDERFVEPHFTRAQQQQMFMEKLWRSDLPTSSRTTQQVTQPNITSVTEKQVRAYEQSAYKHAINDLKIQLKEHRKFHNDIDNRLHAEARRILSMTEAMVASGNKNIDITKLTEGLNDVTYALKNQYNSHALDKAADFAATLPSKEPYSQAFKYFLGALAVTACLGVIAAAVMIGLSSYGVATPLSVGMIKGALVTTSAFITHLWAGTVVPTLASSAFSTGAVSVPVVGVTLPGASASIGTVTIAAESAVLAAEIIAIKNAANMPEKAQSPKEALFHEFKKAADNLREPQQNETHDATSTHDPLTITSRKN